MTKAKRAAAIWAALERHLIERCGLPAGRMLDINRPYLIRWIGERLKATPVAIEQTVKAPFVQVAGTRGVVSATPPLPVPREQSQSANTAMRNMRNLRSDTIHDPVWAALLEQSCSLRGYDGDDEVSHK
jgi:hypothetical protein